MKIQLLKRLKKKENLFFLRKSSLRRTFMILLFCFGAIQAGYSQNSRHVTGTVSDEKGEPIIGVNVGAKTVSAIGTATDIQGRFVLDVPENVTELTISYIGYETQNVNIRNLNVVNVTLKEAQQFLDEVVVVGYGTQKKATLTGAVVAINNEQIVATKNQNTQNMLTGKLPGLRVIQKTSEPGQFTNQFDIRGLGAPLLVIDGVPRSDLERMDANDIESVSILKDASAAIYGVRAANGVVLITTKNGKKGKAKIEYTGYYGIQTPAEILQPINAYNRAVLFNETTMRSITAPVKTYNEAYFEQLKKGELPDTDWYDVIMRSTAPQQQHDLSISGGSDDVDYYINLGYNDQESFFRTNSANYERYNLRSNVNANITKNLKASVRLNLLMDDTNSQNRSTLEVFKALWRSKPTDPIYANDTDPYYFHPTSGDIENVLPLINTDQSGYSLSKKNIIQSNMSLHYDVPLVKGLSANIMLSYDKIFNENTYFRKEFNEYTYNAANLSYDTYTRNSKTQLTRYSGSSYSKLWNAFLNYDNLFYDAHHVNAMLLYEESYSQGSDFQAARYFDIPIPYLFAGNSTDQIGTGGGLLENANKALVGRLNYDFSSKYLLELAFRYDGSSKFAKGQQWGFFPSVELGWRISEETFFKSALPSVQNLKLRASWGQLGDDSASQFQFIEGYDYPAPAGNPYSLPSGTVFGNTFTNSLGFRNAPNMYITWFTSTMKNIGLDADLWNGLLGFSIDFFQRDRDGLLDTPQILVPGTFGSGFSQANLNADRNKGFEVELRHFNRVNKDLSYHVSGYVSVTRSMLTKWVMSDAFANSYNKWRLDLTNRYLDIWFGKGDAGQYQSYDQIANSVYANAETLPGDPIYEDWNGDGVIDGLDDHPIATTTNPQGNFQDQRNYPLMNLGLTLSGNWKCLDFNVLFQGAAMSYISFGDQMLNPLSWDGNALDIHLDRWHPVNADKDPYDPSNQWISGYYPYGRTRAEINSEFTIQNGAYARLKSMELGFTLPKNFVSDKLGVKNLRLFINAYNLLTITGVKGIDPEKPTDSYGYTYPLNRTFNFGGTLTF
jgi:TonB-linked SusC/RagA family outer membrane protein